MLVRPCEEDADSVRRFAWALALAGRFPDALEVIRGMTHLVEQAKAVRRVMHVAASRDQGFEVSATADLAEALAERAQEAQHDAWRIRAHLARALARGGRLKKACRLAEMVCDDGIAPTEANTLVYPERLRRAPPVRPVRKDRQLDPVASKNKKTRKIKKTGKTGPRPLDTNVRPLPDEAAAQRVGEFARAKRLEAAYAQLELVRVPRARTHALLDLARHEPNPDLARERWIDALISARNVGRRQLDEVLAAHLAVGDSGLRETIETLDARWR